MLGRKGKSPREERTGKTIVGNLLGKLRRAAGTESEGPTGKAL
jgi:hypothetical protein